MNRFLKHVAVAASVVLLLWVVGAFIAPPVIAQVKAALVKNQDEPGRTPYEAQAAFDVTGCDSASCANFLLIPGTPTVVQFDINPPIPAGKRLVVKHVSGWLFTIGANSSCANMQCRVGFETIHNALYFTPKWSFFGPFFTGPYDSAFANTGFASEAFFTVAPGDTPRVYILAQTGFGGYESNIFLNGYLIDATN